MPGEGHPILLIATGVLAVLAALVFLTAPSVAAVEHGLIAGVVLACIATIYATAWMRDRGQRAPMTPSALSFLGLCGVGLVVSSDNPPLCLLATVSYAFALRIYAGAVQLDRLAAQVEAQRDRLAAQVQARRDRSADTGPPDPPEAAG